MARAGKCCGAALSTMTKVMRARRSASGTTGSYGYSTGAAGFGRRWRLTPFSRRVRPEMRCGYGPNAVEGLHRRGKKRRRGQSLAERVRPAGRITTAPRPPVRPTARGICNLIFPEVLELPGRFFCGYSSTRHICAAGLASLANGSRARKMTLSESKNSSEFRSLPNDIIMEHG